MNKRTMYLADSSLLLVALIWGSGFVATKSALNEITPYYLMAFRFTIATLLLVIFFRKRIAAATMQDFVAGCTIGICLFGAFATQTLGLQHIAAGNSAFLTGINVIIVPFLVWALFRIKPDCHAFIATFIAMSGIALLTLEESFILGMGESLTLICALFFAGHIVAVSHFSKNHDPIVLTAIQMTFAMVFSFLFAFYSETSPLETLSAFGWSAILYVGIASSFMAYTIQNVAQKYTSATHAALILSLESVFGTLLAIWLLGESMTPKMVVGCFLILLAIVTAETRWNFLNDFFKTT